MRRNRASRCSAKRSLWCMENDAATRTAYHEAGHAVAAVICGGYVKYINLSGPSLKCADEAFMVWAGPWTQAYWKGDCKTNRIVEIFQTQSYWDWPVYEEAVDPKNAAEVDVRGAARNAEAAELLGRPMPKNAPPVTAPQPNWDAKLRQAWSVKRPGLAGDSDYWIPTRGWSVRSSS